jgi:Fic family protein
MRILLQQRLYGLCKDTNVISNKTNVVDSMNQPSDISLLPVPFDLETKAVLRKTVAANKALAELKGVARTIPNEHILINTLVLQEAQESSAIENIITTHDEVYRAALSQEDEQNINAKEVLNYSAALRTGYDLVRTKGFISGNMICDIQAELVRTNAGFRRVPGTVIKNHQTGEIVHTPPQEYERIVELMRNLESYINNVLSDETDTLVKMAVIHYQFEVIHPFYDGNGRTGRILNVLYLVLNGLLDIPILYLSRYIIRHKAEYYRLLQEVRTEGKWEDWIVYILEGIEQTARETIVLIKEISTLMERFRQRIQEQEPRMYSKDLIEALFKHPYTKVEFLQRELNVHYLTASKYLKRLVEGGILQKHRIGKSNFYINEELFDLLSGDI